MNIAEAAVSTAVVPSVQSVNLQAAEQQSQPKPITAEFGGFHLTYDPQNRELFLVFTDTGTGQVQNQIPGFQTVSSRRNSTPAAPTNLSPDTSSSGSAPTPQAGAPGPSSAPAVGGAPGAGAAASAARGATVNIAS